MILYMLCFICQYFINHDHESLLPTKILKQLQHPPLKDPQIVLVQNLLANTNTNTNFIPVSVLRPIPNNSPSQGKERNPQPAQLQGHGIRHLHGSSVDLVIVGSKL